jgi:hypothetical protein
VLNRAVEICSSFVVQNESMESLKTLVREIELWIVELLAFKLGSLKDALHHHHSPHIPSHYENA